MRRPTIPLLRRAATLTSVLALLVSAPLAAPALPLVPALVPLRTPTPAAAAIAAAPGAAQPTQLSTQPWSPRPGAPAAANVVPACGPAAPGFVRCFALVRTDVHGGKGVRSASSPPPGYGPADLRSAYSLPATGGAGQTIAIVDGGDDLTAEADLAVYRQTYGLPPCTTANGCFRKANQNGAASPLPPDLGVNVEISLDLDLASAACSACRLLLVEGDRPTLPDLAAAVNGAVAAGADEVSNSYGLPEYNGMQALEADYDHPGVAILASSGDSGYGIPSYPAVFPTVIAVGGTTLRKASNTHGWSERAWNGAGSGCSGWIAKPSWQHDPNCPDRMTADVAADADPQTGPAFYDTDNQGPGWLVGGGTSAAAPFVAGVIALAGNPQAFPNASYLYTHAKALHDITTGNNVTSFDCGGDYQCNAIPGYDGPTGNGTPNGIAAF